MLLEGKVGVVSGVGPGLGKQVALAFAREGADLALGARTEAMLKETAGEIEALGRRALWVPTDVTDPEQDRRLVETAVERLGRVDVLVHNAFSTWPMALFEKADLTDWRAMHEVNFWGALHLAQAVIPHMKAQGGGSIVFVNSMAVRKPRVKMGGYATSKAALFVAAQVLAKELGPHKIRVNSVLPGWMWGPSTQGYVDYTAQKTGATPEQVYAGIADDIALGYLPPDEDCAEAVVFLASDRARSITGQTIDVNGGEVFA